LPVLVTGACGFLGSHLVRGLIDADYEVMGIDRKPNPRSPLEKMKVGGVPLAYGDITNPEFVTRIVSTFKPELVVHLAAQSSVPRSYRDPVTTFRVNVEGTYNVLEACLKAGVSSVIHQSTDKVYGNRMNAAETDPYMPVDPYSISKVGADVIAQQYMDKMNVTITRPCNIYGYDHNLERIVPYCIKSCMEGVPPEIRMPGAVRQFLYVDDYVEAIRLLSAEGTSGIYNIGSEDVVSVGEVAEVVCSHFGVEPALGKTKFKEVNFQSVDFTKLKELGFKQRFRLRDGIKRTIEQYMEWGIP